MITVAKCPKTGKIEHPTRETASAALASYRRARAGGSPDLNVYPCGRHWHFGHSSISLRKRIRRSLRTNPTWVPKGNR